MEMDRYRWERLWENTESDTKGHGDVTERCGMSLGIVGDEWDNEIWK